MGAAQEQAIRTNYIKYHIDKTSESPLCRLCGKKGESVQHVTSGCEKLAQKEYKRQHDNVAKKVHWDICKKNGLEHSEKWYEHAPEGAVENEEIKVLWDINIQCENLIEARRPDLIVIDKKEQKGIIIDIGVPADVRIEEKEKEKVEKYQDLKKEIRRLWKLRNVEIFFFYEGFLSRTFTNNRTAGEGERHFFNSSLPLPSTSQTLRH